MACEIHIGDVGTIFEIALTDCDALPIDITSATSLKMIFERPDTTISIKTATMFGPGTEGKIRYIIVSGDLNQVGDWKLQAEITFSSGLWHSNSSGFTVFSNLI